MALARVKHKVPEAQYQGVVLSTPGVLGGSGLRNALIGAQLPAAAADRYDWVGFAPRGLAPSVPALSCQPNYMDYNRPNYVPTTAALENTWRARTKSYADACAAAQPALLDHMKTTDTTADMESIRTALGVPQVTLFAQSYGSYTGEVYSTQYPSRVKRLILDSSVDPRRVWFGAAAFDQDVPLQRNLFLWFDWLASHDDVYHLGKTRAMVNKVWTEQLRRVSATPVEGLVGFDEWIDVFLVSPYFQLAWPTLGSAFAGWVNNGDGATLKALFDQFSQRGNDNTYAALLGQICTDAPWPSNWQTWRNASWAAHAQAPNTTWGNTWFNAPCIDWHADAGQPVRIDGSKVSSALLIHETLDGASPFEGSLEVRSRYPRAALLAETGGISHAAVPNGNPCVNAAIAAYLTDGTLPTRKPGRQADLNCPPNPLPTP
nr:alpha/beta fold hydrolase [Streptomyces sp. SID13031]